MNIPIIGNITYQMLFFGPPPEEKKRLSRQRRRREALDCDDEETENIPPPSTSYYDPKVTPPPPEKQVLVKIRSGSERIGLRRNYVSTKSRSMSFYVDPETKEEWRMVSMSGDHVFLPNEVRWWRYF